VVQSYLSDIALTTQIEELRMKLVEIYLQPERYNARIKATIPAWWVAVYDNGEEQSICPDYVASNPAQAKQVLINSLVGV
jgi:hypothetical protein